MVVFVRGRTGARPSMPKRACACRFEKRRIPSARGGLRCSTDRISTPHGQSKPSMCIAQTRAGMRLRADPLVSHMPAASRCFLRQPSQGTIVSIAS
jgi:hypothetical protein